MGVLACNRTGCDNIMCDKHSNTYGYICNSCYNELLLSGKNIVEFMELEPIDNTVASTMRRYYEQEFIHVNR